MDSRFAATIKQIAMAEASPQPYGKVNDASFQPGEGQTVRFGWRRLKEYFEVAAKFKEQHWKIPGYLDGVKIRGKRIPQPGQSGVSWCGIFATYVWIKAGVPDIRWAMPGVAGPNVKKIAGSAGIGIGDIAVEKGSLVHHCIVTAINGTSVETVNGNSDYQGITIKNKPISNISYFYTVQDDFYNYLESQYGQ